MNYSKRGVRYIAKGLICRCMICASSRVYQDSLADRGSCRIGWGEMLTFLNTGDSFNKARKLLQDPFTQPKCIMFQEMQLSLTHLLLKSMLTNPTEFNAHLKRYGNDQFDDAVLHNVFVIHS